MERTLRYRRQCGISAAGRGRISTIPIPDGDVRRVVLAGLGGSVTGSAIMDAAGRIAKAAKDLKLKEFSIVCPPGPEAAGLVPQIIEGAKMASYSFDRFKAEGSARVPDLTVITESDCAASARTAGTIADGVNFARGIANLPPNECSPATLADTAKSVAKKNGIKCVVTSKADLKRRGFGGITAVGQGSSNEPKLIVMEYAGGKRGERPVLLVGKAVTFDTGGISLKPGDRMDEMKFDKCGGCTILGIMKAVSELKLAVNVVGVVPAVENMPGGGSYRPGDIIRLYSGKTAEILNTDAEGRLILADALSYGEKKYAPGAIIDFATLTGACVVALGTNVAGMISNDDDLAAGIAASSKRTAEDVWRLPLTPDYMDMIKSEVADMKNMGIGRAAGTITAAAFLRNAIGDTPWVHLDIAGVAWTQTATKERSYNPKGATGFGVRLVLDYLQSL